jgi:hypothetical protein
LKLKLERGDTWAGGLDKPLVVSWEAIAEALRESGLVLSDHFARDERPLPFDPSQLRPYSDDWDNVALVRVDRAQTADVPDRIKWVRLMNRVDQRTTATPAELTGFESGLSASIAADEAGRRAREKRKGSALGVYVGIAVTASGFLVPGIVALARSRRRRRY